MQGLAKAVKGLFESSGRLWRFSYQQARLISRTDANEQSSAPLFKVKSAPVGHNNPDTLISNQGSIASPEYSGQISPNRSTYPLSKSRIPSDYQAYYPQYALIPANKVRRFFCVIHGLHEATGCRPGGQSEPAKSSTVIGTRDYYVRRLSEDEKRNEANRQQLEWIRHLELIRKCEDPEHDEELKQAIAFEECDLLLQYRRKIDRTRERISRSARGERVIGDGGYQMSADTSIRWRLDELARRIGPNAESYSHWEIPGFGGLRFRDIIEYSYDGEIKASGEKYTNYITQDGVHVQRGFPSLLSSSVTSFAGQSQTSYLDPRAEYIYKHGVPRAAAAYKSGLEDLLPPTSINDFRKPARRGASPFSRFVHSTQNLHKEVQKSEAPIQNQRNAAIAVMKRPAYLRRTSTDKEIRRKTTGLLPGQSKKSQILERCRVDANDEAVADDDGEDDDYEDAPHSKQVSNNPSPETEKPREGKASSSFAINDGNAIASPPIPCSRIRETHNQSEIDMADRTRATTKRKLERSRKGGLLRGSRATLLKSRPNNDSNDEAFEDISDGSEASETQTSKAKATLGARTSNAKSARVTTADRKGQRVTFRLASPLVGSGISPLPKLAEDNAQGTANPGSRRQNENKAADKIDLDGFSVPVVPSPRPSPRPSTAIVSSTSPEKPSISDTSHSDATNDTSSCASSHSREQVEEAAAAAVVHPPKTRKATSSGVVQVQVSQENGRSVLLLLPLPRRRGLKTLPSIGANKISAVVIMRRKEMARERLRRCLG